LHYFDIFPGVVVPRIDPACRDMVRLLELGWRPDAIAEQKRGLDLVKVGLDLTSPLNFYLEIWISNLK
jgi:hypothetical protein